MMQSARTLELRVEVESCKRELQRKLERPAPHGTEPGLSVGTFRAEDD
jgi:hypothetical protein